MNRMKILLSAVLVFAATASIAQDFSDPRYAPWGDTPEQRKQNIPDEQPAEGSCRYPRLRRSRCLFPYACTGGSFGFRSDLYSGAQVYSNKVQRAQDLNEKKLCSIR